jgi:hypothetical protein
MASDKLRGEIKDWKRAHRGVFATGGAWRKPANHVADSHGGKTAAGKGDAARNVQLMEKHQGGRTTNPLRWGVPYSTHAPDSAISRPKRSRRQPVS